MGTLGADTMPCVRAPVTMRGAPAFPPAKPARSAWSEQRRRLQRYAIAHGAAYPIAFAWAAASIPLVIHIFHNLLDSQDDIAVGQFVVHKLAWPAGVAFALPHLLALPWAFGADTARWRRFAWIGIGAVAGTALVFGGASWLWLVLR
jgi:hypothetical protein